MNRGGDPERDDYGLPPVDIEIPDDARELDRDVQAYYRELRAQRRHRLLLKLAGPLARDGMILPLLASCLALTLLAGTLLTMFTARRVAAPATRTTSTPRRITPRPGQTGGPLPAASVLIGGRVTWLRDLQPAVIALVPAHCGCLTAASQLNAQAKSARVRLYLAAAGRDELSVAKLAQEPGLAASHLVQDSGNILSHAYPVTGLTVILVAHDGLVRDVRADVLPGVQLESSLRALLSSSPQGLDVPGGPVLAAGQARL